MESRTQSVEISGENLSGSLYSQVLIGTGGLGEFKSRKNLQQNTVMRIIKQIKEIIKVTHKHHKQLKDNPAFHELVTSFITNEFSFYTKKNPLTADEFLTITQNIEMDMKDLPPNVHLILASFPVRNKKGKVDNVVLVAHSPQNPHAEVEFQCIIKQWPHHFDPVYSDVKARDRLHYEKLFKEDVNQHNCAIKITTAQGKSFIMVVEICRDHLFKTGISDTEGLITQLSDHGETIPNVGIHFVTSHSIFIKTHYRIAQVVHADPQHFSKSNKKVSSCVDCNGGDYLNHTDFDNPKSDLMENHFGSLEIVSVYPPRQIKKIKFHNFADHFIFYDETKEIVLKEKIKNYLEQKKYYLALKNIIRLLTLQCKNNITLDLTYARHLIQMITTLTHNDFTLCEIDSLKKQLLHVADLKNKTSQLTKWLKTNELKFISYEDFAFYFKYYLVESVDNANRVCLLKSYIEMSSENILQLAHLLPIEERYAFVVKNFAQIPSREILEDLSDLFDYSVLQRLIDEVTTSLSIYQLLAIIKILSEKHVFEYVTQNFHLVQSEEHLVDILQVLDDDQEQYELAKAGLEKITDVELSTVVGNLPIKLRFAFVKEFLYKIERSTDLVETLNLLTKKEQLKLINEYINLQQCPKVFNLLSPRHWGKIKRDLTKTRTVTTFSIYQRGKGKQQNNRINKKANKCNSFF